MPKIQFNKITVLSEYMEEPNGFHYHHFNVFVSNSLFSIVYSVTTWLFLKCHLEEFFYSIKATC